MDHLGSAEKPKVLGSRRLAQVHWGSEGPLKSNHTPKKKKYDMDHLGSAEKPKAQESRRSAQAHWGSEGHWVPAEEQSGKPKALGSTESAQALEEETQKLWPIWDRLAKRRAKSMGSTELAEAQREKKRNLHGSTGSA
ncbi:Hypothetical predicted protein [Prunus dulcis]|uniref:Uncharacterized protein n=1 Tax=Prunus dulcis TaxID=3755 RepID=A0A5E4EIW9_PRUDU|nr:hypothetical protein L3X38_044219 [Prunus dulcis]VVA15637.1 Hypothetical predicted protein [Prunus dulcis]